MAGGPSAPPLVTAAARAGGLGWLAGGYKTAAAMRAEISAVRRAGTGAFGVNLFVPGAPARDQGALAGYLASLQADADRLGAAAGDPVWDDDHWEAKLAVLAADPPPAVSFTFGCPPASVIRGLQDAGHGAGRTDVAEGRAGNDDDRGAHQLPDQVANGMRLAGPRRAVEQQAALEVLAAGPEQLGVAGDAEHMLLDAVEKDGRQDDPGTVQLRAVQE